LVAAIDDLLGSQTTIIGDEGDRLAAIIDRVLGDIGGPVWIILPIAGQVIDPGPRERGGVWRACEEVRIIGVGRESPINAHGKQGRGQQQQSKKNFPARRLLHEGECRAKEWEGETDMTSLAAALARRGGFPARHGPAP